MYSFDFVFQYLYYSAILYIVVLSFFLYVFYFFFFFTFFFFFFFFLFSLVFLFFFFFFFSSRRRHTRWTGDWSSDVCSSDLTERAAREHALDRLLNDPLGKPAGQNGLGRAFLDAADKPGVLVIDFLLHLAPGEHNFGCVDHDHVVTAVDVRGECWLVLAAQPQRHERSEPADHQTVCVDHYPLLLDLGGLRRIACHGCIPFFS